MTSQPIGGAIPAQMPAAAGSLPKGDKAIAKATVTKITAALKTTHDPQLKATFATSLAGLSQYLAQDTRAAKKGLAPKVSSKATPVVKPPKSKK